MSLDLEALSHVLTALAEPARLRLVALCQHGELTVKDLTESTGMSQPRVSRHLRILVEAQVLERFREAHWVYYRLSFDGEAASFSRAALAKVSKHSPVLNADAKNLGTVLAARARDLRSAASGGDQDSQVALSPIAATRIEQAIKQFAEKALGPSGLGNLLDVGTGSGRMLRAVAADARRAEGIDTSEEKRYAARAALREAGLANCTIREGDMYHLPYGDSTFDTVLCGHVLTCAEEPWTVVAEATRVLKSNGHLLVMEILPTGLPVEAWRRTLAGWIAKTGLTTITEESLSLPSATAVLNLSRRESPDEKLLDLAIV